MRIQVKGKMCRVLDYRQISCKHLQDILNGKEPCEVLINKLPNNINKREVDFLNELVSDKLVIPDAFTNRWKKEGELLQWAAGLNINVFEGIRAEIQRREEKTALAIPFILDAVKVPKKLRKYHWEIGLKVYTAIGLFLDHWSNYGIFDEPTEQEADAMEEAGVHIIGSFEAYPIIQKIAERYGKLPMEIERETAGWVYKDYVYNECRDDYKTKYQKIMARKRG